MVVVSDTSVLLDLDRGSLLTAAFRLSCAFAVPDLLFERELKGRGGGDLRERGLKVKTLGGGGVALALGYHRATGRCRCRTASRSPWRKPAGGCC